MTPPATPEKELRAYRPSNGTEGEIFYENWCSRCERERAYIASQAGGSDGDPSLACPILTATLVHGVRDADYPKEWVYTLNDGKWTDDADPRCTAFEPTRP